MAIKQKGRKETMEPPTLLVRGIVAWDGGGAHGSLDLVGARAPSRIVTKEDRHFFDDGSGVVRRRGGANQGCNLRRVAFEAEDLGTLQIVPL